MENSENLFKGYGYGCSDEVVKARFSDVVPAIGGSAKATVSVVIDDVDDGGVDRPEQGSNGEFFGLDVFICGPGDGSGLEYGIITKRYITNGCHESTVPGYEGG